MKIVLLILVLCLLVISLPATLFADPSYIYGLHDNGGEYLMANKSAKGWIVFTTSIGSNPGDMSGGDYTSWSNAGYGVVVRLNNGYGYDGTLPYESSYDNFATRCKNYVNASSGVAYWIIGNECNLPREWPGNIDGDPNTGEAITVTRYVSCYNKCYTQIKSVKPAAMLCPAPSGTWAPPYDGSLGLPNRGIPGFLDYWTQCLNSIGASKVDGLSLHAYTHGCDPALVTSNMLMGAPYSTIYYHFRVYKNYMQSMPTGFTTKPVMITECDENIECADGNGRTWSNTNSGWVRNIYSEINSWNGANAQKIRCVALFRWTDTYEGQYNFGISPRSGVIDDFNLAMDNHYTWGTAPSTGTISGNVKNQAGENISGATITTSPVTSTATTDASGNYTISNVTAGTYSVTAAKTGFNSSTQTGKTVTGGQTTTVNYTLTFIDNMNSNAPAGTNIALSATSFSTDSNYDAAYDGGKAKDGVISAASKWCSTGTVATHWLVFDLGATKTVNGYILRGAGGAGELTSYNTKNFKIQSGTSMTGPWTDETIVDNSAQANNITKNYITAKQLRYIRLYITNPGIDNYSRIPEFEVWGTGSSSTGTISGNVKSGGVNLSGATVQTNTGGYSTTTDSSGNYTLSNVATGTYNVTASKSGYNSSTNNNVTVTANTTTTSNFTLTTATVTSQNFETMPSWTSSFNAAWGSAATWSIVGGGQSGNFLQASRTSQGSSAKVLVYNVNASTNYTITIYIKCPSSSNTYWVETAYKLGSNTATDFDGNAATWTQIKKFANDGTNGNGNVWTQYTATVATGSNTQISIGYKQGASGGNGPTVGWDTFLMQ